MANDNGVCLRAAVYYAKMGAYAEVTIKGFLDLRQVSCAAGILICPRAISLSFCTYNVCERLFSCLLYIISVRCAILQIDVDDPLGGLALCR